MDLVVLRPIEGFGNWWGSEDSMVLEGAANVRSMRRLLETKGKINPAFFNCLPPEANGVFEQTRLENLVRAKTDGRDRIRKSMQKSAVGATKKYQVRQLECASMALAELSGSTMAMSRLEKNVVLPYRWESEDDNQVLTAVNRVSDEFEESFTVIEGGKGTMADAAAAFNRYTTKKGDQLFANDVDMVIDWLAWIMVWGIRISVLGGMLLAAATTGPVGIVAGAATGMGVLKIADYVEKGAAALRVGIVGLWTVPFAFQLQRDVLFAAAQTYDEVFEQGNL